MGWNTHIELLINNEVGRVGPSVEFFLEFNPFRPTLPNAFI